MRRVMAMVATTILVLGGGCGSKSYEFRLDRTLESMRYRKRLDDNLMPPPAKGIAPFEELAIFLRPPKNLEQSKEFQMTVLEPGQFDLQSSFFEEKKQNLHVLARVKKPKGSASKKARGPHPRRYRRARRVQPRRRRASSATSTGSPTTWGSRNSRRCPRRRTSSSITPSRRATRTSRSISTSPTPTRWP